MTILKRICVLGLISLLAACSAGNTVATRAINVDPSAQTKPDSSIKAFAPKTDRAPAAPRIRVEKIRVVVPRTLEVSEANRYLPAGDIVWREDPIGDRHEQVQSIFQSGLEKGTARMNGARPVSLYVQVMRFHALTEKARYTTGGVHSIKFGLAVRDLTTGNFLTEPRVIEADLKAYGGRQALEAESNGLTQKVRITEHLAEVIWEELTKEDGHENVQLGLIQQLNKF